MTPHFYVLCARTYSYHGSCPYSSLSQSRRFRRTFNCHPSKLTTSDPVPAEIPDKQSSEPIQGLDAIELSPARPDAADAHRPMYTTRSITAINESSPRLSAFRQFHSRIPRSSTGGELARKFEKRQESSTSRVFHDYFFPHGDFSSIQNVVFALKLKSCPQASFSRIPLQVYRENSTW